MEGACERAALEFARLCGPITDSPMPGYSWQEFARQLAEYGRLLQHWPDIFQLARESRRDGVRLSAALDTVA